MTAQQPTWVQSPARQQQPSPPLSSHSPQQQHSKHQHHHPLHHQQHPQHSHQHQHQHQHQHLPGSSSPSSQPSAIQQASPAASLLNIHSPNHRSVQPPRLTIGIPISPNVKPVNSTGVPLRDISNLPSSSIASTAANTATAPCTSATTTAAPGSDTVPTATATANDPSSSSLSNAQLNPIPGVASAATSGPKPAPPRPARPSPPKLRLNTGNALDSNAASIANGHGIGVEDAPPAVSSNVSASASASTSTPKPIPRPLQIGKGTQSQIQSQAAAAAPGESGVTAAAAATAGGGVSSSGVPNPTSAEYPFGSESITQSSNTASTTSGANTSGTSSPYSKFSRHPYAYPSSSAAATPVGSSSTGTINSQPSAALLASAAETAGAAGSSSNSVGNSTNGSSNNNSTNSGSSNNNNNTATTTTGPDHLKKLSYELGRAPDVEDLDEEGWNAVRAQDQIDILEPSLGEGISGAVDKCRLKWGTTVFALKVIITDPNPDVRKQIFREISFNKDCRSDYICRYYGAFIDHSQSKISLAMEFCEGGSLDSVYRQVRKRGGRTGERVLGKIAESVLRGLAYLHEHKIIHRDIKPSNILLFRGGQVKLCDLGVSGDHGTRGDASTFIGTQYYMAPERITGKSYTITSDVWSLGVTILEVAQHRFPFPAEPETTDEDGGAAMHPRAALIDLLTYIVRQEIPVLKDEPARNLYWSANFKSFIACCLERNGEARRKPAEMLEHPWMLELRHKKVNMARFLQVIWNWE